MVDSRQALVRMLRSMGVDPDNVGDEPITLEPAGEDRYLVRWHGIGWVSVSEMREFFEDD